MDDVILVNDQFYILVASARLDDRTRVLKSNDTFAVLNRSGDVPDQRTGGEHGLYHDGTRYLSRSELRFGTQAPLLLGSELSRSNALLTVHLSNPDLYQDGHLVLQRGVIHLERARFLWDGVCHERLAVTSFAVEPVEITLDLRLGADFADVFEVRGMTRARRGRLLPPEAGVDTLVLGYEGLDGTTRRTRIHVSPAPATLSPSSTHFAFRIEPHVTTTCLLTVSCEVGTAAPRARQWTGALGEAITAEAGRLGGSHVHTSSPEFNAWVDRSGADLRMMITDAPTGPFPYAGIPWFSTPFGRDALVTALETLWLYPEVARGSLAYLALTQAEAVDPERDAEPGKILHEARGGEMAALQEVPFGQYYGSADATPLFVLLAGAYWRRTGDRPFVTSLWTHVERALAWIDGPGMAGGSGFLTYARRSTRGLVNQGWKDSHDSVFHADGTLAEGPIALCEIQAYVYAAKRAAAGVARALGHARQAASLLREADDFQRHFTTAFWCQDLGTYALAIDGRGRRCTVRSSNAGQCLFTGIARDDHARRIAAGMLDPTLFSGWGVRTIGRGERRYNPMSYHNGSVWPHDNALVAWGCARYGHKEAAVQILSGLFDASRTVERRLPELFCGFQRDGDEGPTLYPVACAPQAWAAASVFLLLQACLGLEIDAPRGQLRFDRPALPRTLRTVRIEGLRVGAATVDLDIVRHEEDVGIDVVRRDGEVAIAVVKS
jgi:glycogen debranching enzyme